jgi:hypothetical protein
MGEFKGSAIIWRVICTLATPYPRNFDLGRPYRYYGEVEVQAPFIIGVTKTTMSTLRQTRYFLRKHQRIKRIKRLYYPRQSLSQYV